jgi:hypothetical protein
MSTINTNGLNVNYPVPGVNNNSQGFRDNFNTIKTNLDVAGTEITDLQTNVVLKSALQNSVLNNDMANTLISNAAVRSFRHTTYNLGNSLSGTVLVDVSLGDVQIGTVSGNVTFTFGSWAPTGTQSNVQLQLSVSNANAVISFPEQVIQSNGNYGTTLLENYANVANVPTVTVPYGVTQLDYNLSSIDCGDTITIEPYNRPQQTTQVQQRLVPPTGFLGDVAGTITLGNVYNQLSISSSNSADYFTTANTAQLYTDLPIVFTGVTMEANVTVGTTYYVRNVVSSTTFSVSSSLGGANVNLAGNASPTSSMYGNPVSYTYVCTDTYDATTNERNVLSTTVTTNVVTLNNTTSLVTNAPIIFNANIGGIVANTIYYIKSISSPNITVSQSRTNGVADTVVTLTTDTTGTTANIYIGSDIWKRIALTSW